MFRVFSAVILFLISTVPAFADTRADVLKRLHVVQETYNMNLNEINKMISQQIIATQTIHMGTKNEQISQHNLDAQMEQLTSLRGKYFELKTRIYLIDRLIFETEAKFSNGTSTKTFFEQQLLEMAYTELTNSETKLWQFMINLSMALREIHNPHEDVVGFIEGYTSYSSVLDPKSPFNFLRDGNYVNGAQVQSANPLSSELLGEAWEDQVKKLNHNPDMFKSESANVEHITLPEILGQAKEDPIPTRTIFDKPDYEESNPNSQQGPPTDFKLQFDGYSAY